MFASIGLVIFDITAAPALYVIEQLFSWSLCSSLKIPRLY